VFVYFSFVFQDASMSRFPIALPDWSDSYFVLSNPLPFLRPTLLFFHFFFLIAPFTCAFVDHYVFFLRSSWSSDFGPSLFRLSQVSFVLDGAVLIPFT